MYQTVNNPFTCNPYDDNQKFLKQVFSKPFVLGIVILLGVILAVNVYNLINTFLSPTLLDSTLAQSNPELYNNLQGLQSLSTSQIISQGISIVLYLLPFIGFLLLYTRSRNPDDSSSIRTGITMIKAFSIIMLVFMSLLTVLCVILVFMLSFIIENAGGTGSPAVSTAVAVISLIIILPILALYFLWIISAIRLCSSAQKAIDGQPLTSKGALPVGVLSIISACIMGLSAISSLSSIISSFSFSYVISLISALAMTILNILIAVLAFAYRKAVNDANYSIAYSGANRYTGNVSNSTAYYQSTYQDPYADTSNPPQNTQNYQQQSFPTICPFCGANVSPDDKFCNNCGTRIK